MSIAKDTRDNRIKIAQAKNAGKKAKVRFVSSLSRSLVLDLLRVSPLLSTLVVPPQHRDRHSFSPLFFRRTEQNIPAPVVNSDSSSSSEDEPDAPLAKPKPAPSKPKPRPVSPPPKKKVAAGGAKGKGRASETIVGEKKKKKKAISSGESLEGTRSRRRKMS